MALGSGATGATGAGGIFSNPQTLMPLLGMMQGLAQGGMPSRMPIPFGAALGMGAGGMMQGMGQAADLGIKQGELRNANIQGALTLGQANAMRAAAGLAPIDPNDPYGLNKSTAAAHTPAPTVAAATGAATGAQPVATTTAAPLSAAQPSSGDVRGIITSTADKYGINPTSFLREGQIESSLNPDASNGSAKGLFQFEPSTAKQYGLTNPMDPAASADAAARLWVANRAALTKALGRPPTDAEVYLAHQQGATGAAALLRNPDAPARDIVGVGAVVGNGGNPNMTAGQFASMWTNKFNGTAPGVGGPPQTGDYSASPSSSTEMPAVPLPPSFMLPLNNGVVPPPSGVMPSLPADTSSPMARPANAGPAAGAPMSMAPPAQAPAAAAGAPGVYAKGKVGGAFGPLMPFLAPYGISSPQQAAMMAYTNPQALNAILTKAIPPSVQSMRQGGSIVGFRPDGSYGLLYQAPVLGAGIRMAPNGDAEVVPGYNAAATSTEAAREAGNAQYQPMDVVGADGTHYVVPRSVLGAYASPAPRGAAPAPAPMPPASSAPAPASRVTAPPSAASATGFAPAAGGPAAMPRIMTGLGPMAATELKTRGEELGKVPDDLVDEAEAAVRSNALLDEMRASAPTWRQGKWADVENDARSSLQALGKMVGADTSGLDKPLADFQQFKKDAMQIVTTATRQVSSRAAVQEMKMISEALPGPEMSKLGFQQVADQLQGLNDYNIAKSTAAQAWFQQHGTLNGFEPNWNMRVTPAAFWINRMTPQAFHEAATKIVSQPGGKATLQRMMGEVKWAQGQGLLSTPGAP